MTNSRCRDERGADASVLAVCVSRGSIPKKPVAEAEVVASGLVGDGHEHEKHIKPHRAVLIQDVELLDGLRAEGYAVGPGVMGENLTVRGLGVQEMLPGTRLRLVGGPLLELTEARRPCFVLDKIDPQLQHDVVGRGGVFARVLEPGRVHVDQRIEVVYQPAADGVSADRS